MMVITLITLDGYCSRDIIHLYDFIIISELKTLHAYIDTYNINLVYSETSVLR